MAGRWAEGGLGGVPAGDEGAYGEACCQVLEGVYLQVKILSIFVVFFSAGADLFRMEFEKILEKGDGGV